MGLWRSECQPGASSPSLSLSQGVVWEACDSHLQSYLRTIGGMGSRFHHWSDGSKGESGGWQFWSRWRCAWILTSLKMCVSKVQLIRMSRKGSALKKRITVSLLDKCRICRDAQIKTNQTSVWYGMVNQTSVWYNMVNTKAQYGMVWYGQQQ